MKVVILGGTGYIGFAVGCAFNRAGHEVAATIRHTHQANGLIGEEIVPVPPNAWDCSLNEFDVVVDCLGDPKMSECALKIVCKNNQGSARRFHPITYIYTSGLWVHGSCALPGGHYGVVDERGGGGHVEKWYRAKAQMENKVLSSSDITPIVIRPGLVYGRGMGKFNEVFLSAYRGQIHWPASDDTRWSTIHIDDLVDLFVRVAESAPICRGICFEACNPASESARDVLGALMTASTVKDVQYHDPSTFDEHLLASTMISHPSLARSILGWYPKKRTMCDGMDSYWMSWVSNSSLLDPTGRTIPAHKTPLGAQPQKNLHTQPQVQHVHPPPHQAAYAQQYTQQANGLGLQPESMGLVQIQQRLRMAAQPPSNPGPASHHSFSPHPDQVQAAEMARMQQQQQQQQYAQHMHKTPGPQSPYAPSPQNMHVPYNSMPTPMSIPSPSQAAPPAGVLTPPGSVHGYGSR